MWKFCQAFRLRYQSVLEHSTRLPPQYPQRILADFTLGLGILIIGAKKNFRPHRSGTGRRFWAAFPLERRSRPEMGNATDLHGGTRYTGLAALCPVPLHPVSCTLYPVPCTPPYPPTPPDQTPPLIPCIFSRMPQSKRALRQTSSAQALATAPTLGGVPPQVHTSSQQNSPQ